MSTLKGIFEPFRPWIQKQLRVRRVILANSNPLYIPNASANAGFVEGPKDFSWGHDLHSRAKVYDEESFYAYTVEKQCIIRMMSGVDIRPNAKGILEEEAADPNLSYIRWHQQGLAKQYILESGTQFYNERGSHGGLREGFTPENNEDYTRAFSYGDKNIRANAGDDFGIVPMPGIIDAEIRTKSDNGSLREARVNFVCHNRRQLEVLEMLYMRPGYPICLEWGWNPYINNEGKRKNNDFSIREEFFDPDQNLEGLNKKITDYKREAAGNFDGFIGYCKNFNFKANEIGGYECTTEIIAHGEILESLKTQKTVKNIGNFTRKDIAEIELTDSLLYYLRSVKNTLRSPADMTFLSHLNIESEQHGDYTDLHDHEIWDKMRTNIGYVGEGCPRFFKGNRLITINYGQVDLFTCVYENNVSIPITISDKVIASGSSWKPKPLDSRLLKDETREVTVNREYLQDMSFDQYSYLYETGQGLTSDYSYWNRQNFGIVTPHGENRTWDESAWLKNHAHYQWVRKTKSGKVNNFIRGVEGWFEDGEWGIQRDELIYRKVQTTSGLTDEELHQGRAEAIKARNEDLQLIDAKLLSYKKGYLDIKQLWQYINKLEQSEGLEEIDLPNNDAGIGFESMLGGSVLKQTVKYATGEVDSGYKRNIFIRWDLLCQMINHLCIYKKERGSDLDENASMKDYLSKYKLKHPDMEFTYKNRNSRTWSNKNVKDAQSDSYYLPYTAPYVSPTDPIKEMIVPKNIGTVNYMQIIKDKQGPKKPEKLNLSKKQINIEKYNKFEEDLKFKMDDYLAAPVDNTAVTGYDQSIEHIYSQAKVTLTSAEAERVLGNIDAELNRIGGHDRMDSNSGGGGDVERKKVSDGDYHPLIGASLDEGVCLMPHQGVFDTVFDKDITYYDSTIIETKAPTKMQIGDQVLDVEVGTGNVVDRINDNLVGKKVDFKDISSFTSDKTNDRHSIGYVYFNVDFLVSTFENQRLKQWEAKETEKHTTLNDDFDMYSYIKQLWDGVNTACGNYYNFIIHTEHERPHVNRIIDLRVSGKYNPEMDAENRIFEFKPQGLQSITRQFYYDSAISSDMASAIAIAASNPADMQEMDALSFKAFNKNIKSRWNKYDPEDEEKEAKLLKKELEEDIQRYSAIFHQVNFYLFKMYEGNMQPESIRTKEGTTIPYIQMGGALSMVNELRALRTNINNRVPLQNDKGEDNKDAGRWLTEVTNEISPIIPIQFSLQMDGIAGMLPLNLFKIAKDRLPNGYKADNIAFVIKSEQQKITNNQDWIVSITGQMCLLNTLQNKGSNAWASSQIDLESREGIQTEEDISTNADLVRNVIKPLGHGENNYVGTREGYESGELSSGGDISTQMKDFIIYMVKGMADPSIAGFNHALTGQKLHFTGGNDIMHKQNHPNSKHVSGNAVDFILKNGSSHDKLDMMLDFLLKIKEVKYPNLVIKDEYRYPNESGLHQYLHSRNDNTTGAHIHLQLT